MQLVVLTSHQRMQLAVSGKVLKLPQTQAVQHCDDVMRQANVHAQSIIDEANQEGDAIRMRATEDAQRIAQEIIAASVIQAGLIKQAAAAMLEKQLLDIVLSSLKAVLKEQPPSQLMTQALHILRSSMAQARWINVLVHPSKQHVATHAVSQFQSQVPLHKADIIDR
jgi:type III secretion protein L